jgi:outer membrane biosynthesis protein TonB
VLARPTPKPPENIPEQFVETPDQPEVETPEPVDTKRMSDKTVRTPEETKAPAAERREAKPPARPQKPPGAPPEKPASESDDVAGVDNRQPAAKDGPGKPTSVMQPNQRERIMLPPGSEAAAMQALKQADAAFGSNDHLPDVKDGSATILNADRHRFADFFLKVKSQVERHWQPSQVYMQRDPTGQVYGVKDRYTVLRIRLDARGTLVQTTTSRASGLDFMDEEARRAFREAAPFLNPPVGLVAADGFITFEFGFYFEIGTSRLRTNWRRL